MSDFGKIEVGSPIAPSSQMMIDGGTIAAATFDDWVASLDTQIFQLSI